MLWVFLANTTGTSKYLGGNAGNADPGCLDGQDLVHLYVCKAALELLSHLLQETDIHLMV